MITWPASAWLLGQRNTWSEGVAYDMTVQTEAQDVLLNMFADMLAMVVIMINEGRDRAAIYA